MHYSVLVVDDEVELSEYTAKYFNMSGVETAYVLDAKSAMEFFKENTCSLVLLDINLGEDSGFELCQTIRQTMNIPIFFISARSAEDDMLLALSIGGDDYICKPYSLGVLLAKVKAELKRYEESAGKNAAESSGDKEIVRLGNAVINLRSASVEKDGKRVSLKAMEYKLLVYMLNNPGRVISKDEFFEKIWDTQFVGDVTLNVHIRHLREKIEDDPGSPKYIKTVWGVGFIFENEE
jgi:Response regulators consisting of a CheY-like receiver domain and a winged-helix DNA-binding domain